MGFTGWDLQEYYSSLVFSREDIEPEIYDLGSESSHFGPSEVLPRSTSPHDSLQVLEIL